MYLSPLANNKTHFFFFYMHETPKLDKNDSLMFVITLNHSRDDIIIEYPVVNMNEWALGSFFRFFNIERVVNIHNMFVKAFFEF